MYDLFRTAPDRLLRPTTGSTNLTLFGKNKNPGGQVSEAQVEIACQPAVLLGIAARLLSRFDGEAPLLDHGRTGARRSEFEQHPLDRKSVV